MEMSCLKKLGKAIAEASEYMRIAVCLFFVYETVSHMLCFGFSKRTSYIVACTYLRL